MVAKTDEKKAAKDVFLICGSDEYRVAEEARAAVQRLCPPADQAMGLDAVDGAVETEDAATAALGRCLAALRTAGFFGASKLVWLKDAALLGDTDLLKKEGVKDLLAEIAGECKRGLLPGVKFIISSSRVDGRTSFYKAMQTVAEVASYNLPEKQRDFEEHTRDFIEHLLQRHGLTARYEAIEALIGRCGAGSRELAGEVEKLALYILPRTKVEVEDVLAVVSPSRETAGWDLADHFGKRDLPAALRTLRQLLFQRESPHGLIAGLEGRIRDMIILKECLQRRWVRLSGSGDWQKTEWSDAPEAVAVFTSLSNDPRKMNPWRGGKLAAQAARFATDELMRLHALAADTHERMLSSGVAPELLLEFFLIKALGTPRNAKN
jgi:DNA polymerase III delta subunit